MNNDLASWILKKDELHQVILLRDANSKRPSRKVLITQDQGLVFSVQISAFEPDPEDSTSWQWRDPGSNPRAMEMPPYYISDVMDATINMREAAQKSRGEVIDYHLQGANSITKKTFEAACRYLECSNVGLPCLPEPFMTL